MTESKTMHSPAGTDNRYFTIAVVSFALIAFEIAVTRILSVVLWYHWAFLSVSLAMLGLGAPGVWISLRRPSADLLPRLLLAAAVLTPLSVVLILKLGWLFGQYTILFCLGALLPAYVSLGAVICLLLMQAPGRKVGRMYGYDLLGACAGAMAIVPMMKWMPTPWMAGALGLLILLARQLLVRRLEVVSGLFALLLVAALVWTEPFQLRYTKRFDEASFPPVYERWTPTARLTFYEDSILRTGAVESSRPFGWGWGRKMQPTQVDQLRILQDGGAGTPITRFSGDIGEHDYLFFDVTTVGYQLRPPQRVAIIGAGGGRDILTSLLAGAKDIDAIELHGALIEELSGRYREYSGDIYRQSGVHAIVGEGRSVLTRSTDRFDLIQISLIDSWAATTAGAYSLSEANLYTVEAYRLYWSRLSDRGMVSTSRWMTGTEGAELPRLLLLQREALAREGIERPQDHTAVVQGRQVGTVLLSKTPFDAAERERLQEISDERGFTLHFPNPGPAQARSPIAPAIVDGRLPDGLQRLNLSPPTDDRPFFFQVLSPFRRVEIERTKSLGVNSEPIFALQVLMVVMTVLTLVLFLLPFALTKRLRRAPGFWRGSGYFGAIGLGFMLVEIPWLQRFILYLGHPSHAATVVLGTLLVGAGLGSLASVRIPPGMFGRLGVLTPLWLLGVNQVLHPLFEATLGWSYAARVLIGASLLVPSGFLMGFFFPLGMVRFGDDNKAWYWAINGTFGVLASVFSLALAMQLGFQMVGLIGVVVYAFAGGLLRDPRR